MQPAPVKGSEHSDNNFDLPYLSAWVIMTTILSAPATKSIAPPIPFMSFPGIIHEAIFPEASTSKAPRTVKSTWPPRIIANDSAEEKIDAPVAVVTVCFPALIKSASTSSSVGNGPIPSNPFSDCNITSISSGT